MLKSIRRLIISHAKARAAVWPLAAYGAPAHIAIAIAGDHVPLYTAAATGSGFTRTAFSTPTIRQPIPTSVSGSGMAPRNMKA